MKHKECHHMQIVHHNFTRSKAAPRALNWLYLPSVFLRPVARDIEPLQRGEAYFTVVEDAPGVWWFSLTTGFRCTVTTRQLFRQDELRRRVMRAGGPLIRENWMWGRWPSYVRAAMR